MRVRCWNVYSLVEADGRIKTAIVCSGTSSVAVDKKVHFGVAIWTDTFQDGDHVYQTISGIS